MLIPGIKIGLKDWQEKLDATQAPLAEIWYRIDWAEKYIPMIGDLQKRGVKFGLHFWGTVSSGHEANLAYPGTAQQESIELMRQCIDNAAAAGAVYVNIHSGNYGLMVMDFVHETMLPDPQNRIINPLEAAEVRNQALNELGQYANSLGVRLLVEAIPAMVADGQWNDAQARLNPLPEYPAPLDGLEDLCRMGIIGFTNDFCHTFSMNAESDLNKFWDTTKRFAPYTRVVHVNTLTEPYNGTDAHGGILPEDFSDLTTFPNENQFKELFSLLALQNNDVWLIGEPKDQHVANYFAVQRLIPDVSA